MIRDEGKEYAFVIITNIFYHIRNISSSQKIYLHIFL